MNPKTEAERLVELFIQYTPAEETLEYEQAKQCALICCDNIISLDNPDNIIDVVYFEQIKTEIEKL